LLRRRDALAGVVDFVAAVDAPTEQPPGGRIGARAGDRARAFVGRGDADHRATIDVDLYRHFHALRGRIDLRAVVAAPAIQLAGPANRARVIPTRAHVAPIADRRC